MPDPSIIQTVPKPDYFFLWIYALLALLPPKLETPIILLGPILALAVLALLPFVAGEGEKSWYRRPVAVLSVILIALALGMFTHVAQYSPWSPTMNAWSSQPTPDEYLRKRTALERKGAAVLQEKQCRNCHSLAGTDGQRGPSLDAIATRLNRDQLIRQVLQGGGNMPAYRNSLTPPETTALVSFLSTLHPPNQQPAYDPSRVRVGSDSANSPGPEH